MVRGARKSLSLGLCAAAVGAVSASSDVRVAIEAPVTDLPSAWQVGGPAPADHLLELTFAVRQRNVKTLTETLLRVSDPRAEDYGQHLSLDEVQRLTAPATEDVAVVEAFLREHGLKPHRASSNGDFVVAVASVDAAERLLDAKYSEVRHSDGHVVHRSLGGYTLPADVAAAVDFVGPVSHIPSVHRPRTQDALAASKGIFNSPKMLRELYQVTAEGKAKNNKQAVTAFLGQGYQLASLQRFWKLFCGNITCGQGEPKLVGDATSGRPGVEAMLDIETITGIAGNVESEFWGFSGKSPDNPENEPFLKWLVQMSNTSDADIPKVFSTSYGEDESSWSMGAATRLNSEFQKAGVRGISLLFATGDNGPNCKNGKFNPNGPASSPWVTAVGGTSRGSSWPQPGPNAEKGIGLGSGGFSNYWAMPEWQKTAVAAYLKQPGLPSASEKGFNTSGRAFPDIAAQAEDFYVDAGFPNPGVAGTSCATPTASGVFTLLNDLRLQAGKSTLGFLNPFIYQQAAAFNDVTTGASSGFCGKWPATTGWDAATGVGSPNYEKLAAAVAKLPAGRSTAEEVAIVV